LAPMMGWEKIFNKKTKILILKSGNPGNKKVVIISSLHGNELSGFLLLKKLKKALLPISEKNQCQIILIPFLNVEGIRKKTRNDPISNQDLNRCFEKKNPPSSISFLKLILKNSSLVLDLHCFPETRQTLTGLLFTSKKNEKISSKNKALLNIFSPKIIWHLDFDDLDKSKIGSLGKWLTENNIPNLAIETESPEFLKTTEVISICQKIKKLIISTLSKNENPNTSCLPIFKRKVIFSPKEGIFTPEVKKMELVKKGKIIGSITDLNFGESKVVTNFTGKVVFIRNTVFVKKGEKLAGIAVKEE